MNAIPAQLWLWLQLHSAIYRPDSFVLMLRYCANLKGVRYESTNLNRIVADKSHRVFVASFLSKSDLHGTTLYTMLAQNCRKGKRQWLN